MPQLFSSSTGFLSYGTPGDTRLRLRPHLATELWLRTLEGLVTQILHRMRLLASYTCLHVVGD